MKCISKLITTMCVVLSLYVTCKKIKLISVCQVQIVNSIMTDRNPVKVVDALIGATIHLKCDFCDTSDVTAHKKWYYRKRGIPKNTTVQVGLESRSKITISTSQTLIIQTFEFIDSGIYTCKNEDKDMVFTYVIDGVIKSENFTEIGILDQWPEYNRKWMATLNENLENSGAKDFRLLREKYLFTFRIFTDWESSWGPCESLNGQKGIHTKLGKCRLHPLSSIHSKKQENFKSTNQSGIINNSLTNYYLKDNYDVSCRSIKFKESFPRLSKTVRRIPDFEISEHCYLDKDVYKYKSVKHIEENGHTILICPEIDLIESVVEWFKNDKKLDSSFRYNMATRNVEPHMSIDMYNSLYILHATKNEEAFYSCTVDGAKMEKIDVKVVSKSKILNREFVRYSIYLGFVLSLSLTFYLTGMCVAWHRSSSFEDPLNIQHKK